MGLINLTEVQEQPRQIAVDLTQDQKVTAGDVPGENPGGAQTEEQREKEITDKVKTIVVDGPLGHVVTEVLNEYFRSQEDVGTMMAIVQTPDLQDEKKFDHYLYATDAKTIEKSSMVELANTIAQRVADEDYKKVTISIEMNGGNIGKAASFEEMMIQRGARVVHPTKTVSAEGISDRLLYRLTNAL